MMNATVKKIQDCIVSSGGKIYIVGGAVRDDLMGIKSKDIDFLITGLPLDQISKAVSSLGTVMEVGKSFGIVKAIINGDEYDFAIPRTKEVKTGDKHTDFVVTVDHNASVEDDLSRRDFTINALAKDVDGNIIDIFGGVKDIENQILRCVGNAQDRFKEDPLRILRALQFEARFGFQMELDTAFILMNMVHLLKNVSGERILMEFEKAWMKAPNPCKFAFGLIDLEVGPYLFGDDFNPVPVKVEGTKDDIMNGNFIAYFFHGGNFSRLKPTNEMIEHLDIAIAASTTVFVELTRGIYDVKGKIPLVLCVLRQMLQTNKRSVDDKRISQAIDTLHKYSTLPLKPTELVVSGQELMNMGLVGREIGKMQNNILMAISDGMIANTRKDIMEFVKQ